MADVHLGANDWIRSKGRMVGHQYPGVLFLVVRQIN